MVGIETFFAICSCLGVPTLDCLGSDRNGKILHLRDCAEGHLTDRWSDWFDGLAIRNEPSGETILTGQVTDQAALYGVLTKIHNLNLILVSLHRSGSINDD